MQMEAQNFFTGGYSAEGFFQHQKPADVNNNQFTIDDLLIDFPTDHDAVVNDAFMNNFAGNPADSSTGTAVHSCNSSLSSGEPQFSGNFSSHSFSDSHFNGGELFVPYDDMAELEWLSSFTLESFSCNDLHNLQLISAASKTPATDTWSSESRRLPNRINSVIFQTDVIVPVKARSKRSRAAPRDWTSRLLPLKPRKTTPSNFAGNPKFSTRRCLHCGSDKTPQWRTGPMGPKSLCNACGVRFKSGRLVPEYRPASSPTFVPAKHSNSHRKVIEIRRQKELRKASQQSIRRSSATGACNGGDDYLIPRQSGPSFMDMI